MKSCIPRFVVIGDAFCGFNPVYGQGMTVAGLSVVASGEEIMRSGGKLDGVAQRAERAFGKATEGAWLLATSAAYNWPATEGGERKRCLNRDLGGLKDCRDALAGAV